MLKCAEIIAGEHTGADSWPAAAFYRTAGVAQVRYATAACG